LRGSIPCANPCGMSLNPYDEQTAAAYAAAREIPRDELSEWRDAVRRTCTRRGA